MARSSTHYYNLCVPNEEGNCKRSTHRAGCYFPNTYETRRGLFHRKPRFPRWSWKRYGRNPPRDIKRIWQRKIRRIENLELARSGEILFNSHKWLAGQYGWWL